MAAKIAYTLVADDAAAVAQVEKFITKMGSGAKLVDKEFKKTGQSARSMGDDFTKSIGAMVTGYMSVQAVIGGVTKAMAALNAERKRGADEIKTSASGLAKLSTVADSPADLANLVAESKKSAVEGGVSVSRAADLQFELRSLGYEKERAFAAQLYKVNQDPVQFTKAVKAIQANLGGEAATGNFEQVTNKLFVAAKKAAADPTQVAEAVTSQAGLVSPLGGSADELMSTIAVLSNKFPSASEAGTALGMFSQQAIKKGLGGQGIMGTVANVQRATEGMDEKQFLEFFGAEKSAVRGFNALKEKATQEQIAQVMGTVTGEPGRRLGAVQRSAAMVELNEDTGAELRLRQEKVKSDIALGGALGVKQIERETAVQRISGDTTKSTVSRAIGTGAAKTAEYFGASPDEVAGASGIVDYQDFIGVPALKATYNNIAGLGAMLLGPLERLVQNTGNNDTLTPPAGAETANR